ncbi:sugar ABC transporter ATP-binding protein [Rugamonas rubra]|uniref:sugar ABC transporter ATP-binding protein n=1 Tax=Rugamonas rubra TaxID=758825 RepID=UPI001C2D823F|nr:sugar ABC transporter ATP-binding protein [Rugamonas rubra]
MDLALSGAGAAPALRARGLRKGFDGNLVLDGVDFALAAGEVHAVVGSNGAGKSTLVKLLNGCHQRDGGTLELFGAAVNFSSPRAAGRAGIAMVYQELSLIASMSVAENLFMARWPCSAAGWLDEAALAGAARRLLAELGIALDPWRCVAELSAAEQQLLEIAKAVARQARVLILDEPTAALSARESALLFALLRRLKGQGVAVVYISHSLGDVFAVCDRVSVLRDGRMASCAAVAATSIATVLAEMAGRPPGAAGQQRPQRAPRPAAAPVAAAAADSAAGAAPRTPLLELRNVATAALADVSFAVYPGQVVGLAGLLGSGRSQILAAIFGLARVESGQVLLAGAPVTIGTPRQAIGLGIVLLPEQRRRQGLALELDVADNVLMARHGQARPWRWLVPEQERRSVAALARRLGLRADGAGRAVRYLSGGNQQKVVLAKCLSTPARVMLLDEPMAGIDLQGKLAILRIVDQFAAEGNAVLLVSSDYDDIAGVCDHTLLVRRGRIAGQLAAGQGAAGILAALQ